MTAEEFHDKITHIVDDARTPDQSRIWSDEFFKELEEEKRLHARLKCLEAIKNVKHKACDIVHNDTSVTTTEMCEKKIMNIRIQDVMPEL